MAIDLGLLGEFQAWCGAESLPAPARRPVAVLITITLAGESFADEICRSLDRVKSSSISTRPETIHTHIATLRGAGFPINTIKYGKRVKYLLDPGLYNVDAVCFEERVGRLTGPLRPEEADELLSLWRGDPRTKHRDVDPALWASVLNARNTLIDHIAAMPADRRTGMPHLARFIAMFPTDNRLDPIRPARRLPPRKHLLIVEDQVGATMAALLEEAGYECTLVTSLEEWSNLKDAGLPEFDGALIDLHLRGTDDAMGLWVVKYLRDATEIPTAVVTTNPEQTSYFQKGNWLAEYRLVDLVEKYDRERYLRDLPRTALLLTGADETSRRRRLETWVNTAVRMARWEAEGPGAGQLARDRLPACLKAAQRADSAIKYGTIEAAQREVDALCRQFPPRQR